MTLNYEDLMSRRAEGRRFSYTDTQVMLYHLGIGMGRDPLDERELPFVFEKPALRVVPTISAVLGSGGGSILAGAPIDWNKVLHGEQRLTVHRPFPPAAELIGAVRVSEVTDKGAGKGATITLEVTVTLADGTPLYTTENVMFARADGGFGAPSKSGATRHALPQREPDLVHMSEVRPDQALLYRLNGDRNPLHADPAFAKRAGFPAPILHGLCSYGIACRAVLASVCGYDPGRIGTFDVRFTAPVFPGETIHTDIWVDGETVSFRSRVEARNVIALDNGRCLLRGPAPAGGDQ